MKRIIALLLACVMAVTGCGAAVDSNQKSASEGISNTVEEVAAEASNTLYLYLKYNSTAPDTKSSKHS